MKNITKKHCGKPTSIYPIDYISIYMDRVSNGFDVDTWRNLGRDQNGATKIVYFLGPKEKGDFCQLYAHNPQLEGTQKSQTTDPENYLNIDYEMHLGTENDFFSELLIARSNGNTVFAKPMRTRTHSIFN